MSEFPTSSKEGNRNVSREIPFYNLDMIISLGYRIKTVSIPAMKFGTKEQRKFFKQLLLYKEVC